jgi:ribosome-associated protein
VNESKPSKSAKKREYLELQELGEQLILLSEEQLNQVDLDQDLREAVLEARQINSHSALRRQKQLIGKYMRRIDPAPIRIAVEQVGRQGRESKALFKRAEHWRDRVVAEGNVAIAELVAESGCSSQRLSALSAEFSKTGYAAGQKKIRRQIFREVHQLLTSMMQNQSS